MDLYLEIKGVLDKLLTGWRHVGFIYLHKARYTYN